MTTVSQIISDSLREAGIIEIGEDPSAEQSVEGVRRLNVVIRSLFGNELGDPLTTINYGAEGLNNVFAQNENMSDDVDDIYVPANYRLILNIGNETTLYLPPNPNDGARFALVDNGNNLSTYNVIVNGNGRQVEAADSVTVDTDGLNREWFYRADTGNWVRVTDLTEFDDVPFPLEFDDMLITLLALRLNPRHGAQTSDEMIETLKRIRRIFRARYKQVAEKNSELGLLRLSRTRRSWDVGGSVRLFNRGD